jgi:hypothetical protein
MNSDLTKEQIYEYGKKLVDNSLSDSQVYWNLKIDGQVAKLKEQVEYYKGEIDYYEKTILMWHGYDEEMEKDAKKGLKRAKEQAKYLRGQIRELKGCKYT